MDDYVQDRVSADERAKLENRLLRGPHQRQKLAFAAALDLEAEERAKQKAKVVPLVAPAPKTTRFNPYLKIAATVIVAVGLVFILWLVLGRKSDLDRGMIALNQAQGDQRLIESRISGLNYAENRPTRGNQQGLANRQARDYSERLFMDAVNQRGDAASYHALGRLYLAERNFPKAREQFEKALAKDPNDAQLQSDMGATLLEFGQASDQKLQDLSEALQYLDRALQLNPSLPEALFNRALVLYHLKLYPQAKEAWRKYLQIDPSSPWANEANRNLKLIDAEEQKGQAKRSDLREAYRAAYSSKDREAAWVALKRSRSRAGNYIVEDLLDSYLSLNLAGNKNEASGVAEQLAFAGDVENERVGDRYTSDLVAFYRRTLPEKYAELARARKLDKAAREKYDGSEFDPSIALLTEAQSVFARLGDECEALFAESWIGYNELRLTRSNSQQRFAHLAEVYESRGYQSLFAQSLHAASDALTQRSEYSEVLDQARRALNKAEEIEDDSTRLRCLQQFLSINLTLGNYPEALSYGMKGLEAASDFATEPKLIWTFYSEIAKALCWISLPVAAVEFQREALRLAYAAQWPMIIARSYTQLGIIQERMQQYEPAIQAGLHAIEEGGKIADEKSRLSTISHAYLRLGHIYVDARDFTNALANYNQALAMFIQLDSKMFLYETRKGRFVACAGLGDVAGAQKELDAALDLFETYRDKIHEERNRNAFFDAGQDIYDLGIDFALTRLGDQEKAFDYAETSRARALLDLIHTVPKLIDKDHGLDLQLVPGIKPLPFSDMRDSIPDGVKILEYAVLNDKLVIWVAERGKLDVESRPVAAADLKQQVFSYVSNLANNGDPQQGRELAVSLYRILIQPVEKYLSGTDELCVVPDKMLVNLPFAALRAPDTEKFLIQSHRVVVAPSANVFRTCTVEALQKNLNGPESLLSIGNPSFSRQLFRELDDLPSAAREAEQVAATYNSAPLLGPAATATTVKARMAQADVIHLAAHYLVDPQSPMRSICGSSSSRSLSRPVSRSTTRRSRSTS